MTEGWDQSGDLLQLEEELRWSAAAGDAAAEALEDENATLKKIVADLALDREMLQDINRRKL